MADKKISELTAATSLDGTELLPVVQGGETKQVSASSVASIGLPAIAATLHRSPNAITALFVYDTSKDSDGGAWTEKCQHTSWYNETLNGKWLGAQTSEANARAVSGATTDDYYQLTTDGKFYKLNATSGTTEVFRGNKRSFPKVAAIVAEAASVTIYDLTEVDRPMFARYVNTGAMATGNVAALHAVNGQVFVGGASGLSRLNFATDRLFLHTTSGMSSQAALATSRTAARTTEVGTAFTNAAIADVKATILPDAPVDAVTGLKIPTVAVATGARVDPATAVCGPGRCRLVHRRKPRRTGRGVRPDYQECQHRH